jgi:hypothetical protein
MLDSLQAQPLTEQDRNTVHAIKLHALHTLNTMMDRAIEALDVLTGDPDLENATDAEDEALSPWARASAYAGPGCIIGDPDKGAQEDGELESGL